jgi:hypothetical protein
VANPTWGAFAPRIVGDQDMGRVLAQQQSLLAATGIVGAAPAGALVGRHGTSTALWVDAGTFGAVLLAADLVRTRRGGRHEAPERYAATSSTRLRTFDGLRILKQDRLIWLIFGWTIPFIIVLEGVNVVQVFLVRDDLGASATTFGLLEASFGAGAVAGSWAAGRRATDTSRIRCVLVVLAGTALSIGLAGLAPTVALLAVCLVLLGTFNGGANEPSDPSTSSVRPTPIGARCWPPSTGPRGPVDPRPRPWWSCRQVARSPRDIRGRWGLRVAGCRHARVVAARRGPHPAYPRRAAGLRVRRNVIRCWTIRLCR